MKKSVYRIIILNFITFSFTDFELHLPHLLLVQIESPGGLALHIRLCIGDIWASYAVFVCFVLLVSNDRILSQSQLCTFGNLAVDSEILKDSQSLSFCCLLFVNSSTRVYIHSRQRVVISNFPILTNLRRKNFSFKNRFLRTSASFSSASNPTPEVPGVVVCC